MERENGSSNHPAFDSVQELMISEEPSLTVAKDRPKGPITMTEWLSGSCDIQSCKVVVLNEKRKGDSEDLTKVQKAAGSRSRTSRKNRGEKK